MLLKTKEEHSDILDDPTISMKINDLIFKATMFMKRKGLNSNGRLKLKQTRLLPRPFPSRASKIAPVFDPHGPSRHLLEARREELGTRPLLSQTVGDNPDGTKPLIANSS
jgi:hypothetical protein